jgi:MFS transporter, VNT family, synaptic vesicle glycoprotein 2
MNLNELKDKTKESQTKTTLEDALIRTGFGKFSFVLITLTGSILGCVVLETVGINFVLPIAQCDLSLTTHDKSVLSAIGFVGMIVSSHLWGFLADTRGRKTVIVPTLLTAFVITIFSSFAKSFWVLVLLRFLNGFL